MIDFFDRLDKFMKYKGLNDNKITVSTGISNGLIGKGRKRGGISQENISKILYTYPDLDANWLLTGKGNMLREQTESSSTQIDVTPSQMLEEIKALSVKIGRLEAENKMLREQVKNKRQYNTYPSVTESELKYK